MALLVRKISELDAVNTLLRGGISAGRDIRGGVFGLDALTLIFTTPSATVTFATTPANNQIELTAKQIVDQINATGSMTGYASLDREGRLVIEDPTGAAIVVLTAAGTALAKLGFGAGATGIVYAAPGGAAPALVSVVPTSLGGSTFLLTTEEA